MRCYCDCGYMGSTPMGYANSYGYIAQQHCMNLGDNIQVCVSNVNLKALTATVTVTVDKQTFTLNINGLNPVTFSAKLKGVPVTGTFAVTNWSKLCWGLSVKSVCIPATKLTKEHCAVNLNKSGCLLK